MQILKNFARLSSAAIVAISAIAHAQVAPPALPVPPSQDAPALAAPAAQQAKIDLDQLEKSIFPNDNKPLAFNHILVPLEAFTVQRINNNATKFFKSENVVMAKNSKGEAVYYTVNENARDLFSFLLDKKYKITVFSGLEAGVRDTILNAISLPRSNNVALSKVVKTGEIDWTDKLNIKDFGDVNSTIAIGYKGLDVKPADQVIDAGPYFIPFSDYKSMERFRPKGGDESYAQDEQAWKAERFKIARVMFTLKQTNQDDKATFKAKLQEVNKTAAVKLSDYGVAISDGKWTRLQFAWDISADKKSVQGCSVQDKVDGKSIKSVDIDNCKAALGTKSKFAIDKNSQRVTACEVFTREGVKIESSLQPAACIVGTKDLVYAKEYSSQRCSVFTEENVFVTHLKTESLCGNDRNNAVYDKQSNAWVMYESFQGMEKLSEAALLKRVSWGWDPRSPLKFKFSLLSMVSNDETNNRVKAKIPGACIAAVKKTISSGGHLATRAVLKNSLPLEKYPSADVADNTFFHYTTSGSSFNSVMAKKSYGDFFEYIRTKSDNLWNMVFYMAGDEKSSSSGYGDYGYKFSLKKHGLIFYVQGDMPGTKSSISEINEDVKIELVARNPDLAACSKTVYWNDNGLPKNALNILTTLSAESSGVAAIAYWGINNKIGESTAPGAQWLQILGPWAISSMEQR